MSCRPYLLTLLIHRASWTTLHKVVQHLLSTPESDIQLPTPVKSEPCNESESSTVPKSSSKPIAELE